MLTPKYFLKNVLAGRILFFIVIFISAIISFYFIYSTYINWSKNKNYVYKIKADNPQRQELPPLKLSAQPLGATTQPARRQHTVDALSGIKLSGIIVSTNKSASRAIVKEGGQQTSYTLNQPLNSSPDSRITAIDKNQVTFDHQGQEVRLTLLEELPSSRPQDKKEDASTHQQFALADFIATSTVQEKNTLRGLRLLPRDKTHSFTGTELLPGDIAVRINNLSLTQQADLNQAQEALSRLQMAQFTVVRNSLPRLVNVSVNQFKDVKEN
ncbi:type II secretion system protein GspC [Citrobacter sp.]|uniref:type II secretion system protein GspC n=1 Tax=Citrobacter sp. TaxID=1896336 RepID=UPI002904C037|nr:type II secretion system protein GspC [Citrobacter sp.]MDU1877479.1 type II secretion system protein GspC [Citrobacter sp.]